VGCEGEVRGQARRVQGHEVFRVRVAVGFGRRCGQALAQKEKRQMEAKGLRTKKGKVWFGDARGTRYIRRRMQLVWRGNVAVHKRFNGRQHIRWGVMRGS